VNISCAQAGVLDNNAITAEQRISWRVLDIAPNVFVTVLKMIKGRRKFFCPARLTGRCRGDLINQSMMILP
jgi:hypothetical protein